MGILIIDSPGRGDELAANGRALVEDCYAWDANLAKLDDWLDWLKQVPRRGEQVGEPSPPFTRRSAA